MSVNLSTIASTIGSKIAGIESTLTTTLNGVGLETSTAEMLSIQADIQKWTLATDIQSNVTKTLGDALKGIIQKS
jgi:type III secretion protein F